MTDKKKFTILVADDDIDDQDMIKQALRDCPMELRIVTVDNGMHVVDFLLKRHDFRYDTVIPDLVLLDLNMPLMDGFGVLKEIRKHESLYKLPIYVITISRNTDDWNRALDLGATGFYSKGVNVSDINRIIREVCHECFGIENESSEAGLPGE
jgi:two-component system, response regulator